MGIITIYIPIYFKKRNAHETENPELPVNLINVIISLITFLIWL